MFQFSIVFCKGLNIVIQKDAVSIVFHGFLQNGASLEAERAQSTESIKASDASDASEFEVAVHGDSADSATGWCHALLAETGSAWGLASPMHPVYPMHVPCHGCRICQHPGTASWLKNLCHYKFCMVFVAFTYAACRSAWIGGCLKPSEERDRFRVMSSRQSKRVTE